MHSHVCDILVVCRRSDGLLGGGFAPDKSAKHGGEIYGLVRTKPIHPRGRGTDVEGIGPHVSVPSYSPRDLYSWTNES